MAVIALHDENVLIDRILAGEQNVYAVLVDHYKSLAFSIALKIVENRPEAEEVAQDAFIKAFHHLKNFNREARFSTWLFRIVFNTAISYKRKRKVTFQDVEHTHVADEQLGDDGLHQNDKKQFIRQAMMRLNEADQQALQLFYLNELTLEETAAIFNQPENTVKVRIHRARLRLAEELRAILKQEVLTL